MLKDRSRRADFLRNRKRLLEAAREIIAERGPDALSVSEAARRADLNRTTAYAHFAKRADLAAAVKEAGQRQALEMLAARKPLGKWIDHLVDGIIHDTGMNRLILHDLLEGNAPNREGWDQYTAWIQEIAKEHGAPRGPAPEFMAKFLIAIVLVWPLLADMHYEDSALPAARKRLAGELKRLLLFGFVDPESDPDLQACPGDSDESSRMPISNIQSSHDTGAN